MWNTPISKLTAKTYETDEEGYLVNLADWNKDVAEYIAKTENVEMTPAALGSHQFPARIF